MQVKLHGPKNVPLCQIRSKPSFAGFVACLGNSTAVSLPDGLLEDKVRACPTHGGPLASSLHVRSRSRGDASRPLLGSLEQKPLVLVLGEADSAWQNLREVSGVLEPDPAMRESPVLLTPGFLENCKSAFKLGGILHANPGALLL